MNTIKKLSEIELINVIEHGTDGKKILNENIIARIMLEDGRIMDFIYRLEPYKDLINIACTNEKNGGAVLPFTNHTFWQFNELYKVKGIINTYFKKAPTIEELKDRS